MLIDRAAAIPYVSTVIDDAFGFHAIADLLPNAVLVGWQCGFEPMFVAVQSYLPDTKMTPDEAEELAVDYLLERNWFDNREKTTPDYIIT